MYVEEYSTTVFEVKTNFRVIFVYLLVNGIFIVNAFLLDHKR